MSTRLRQPKCFGGLFRADVSTHGVRRESSQQLLFLVLVFRPARHHPGEPQIGVYCLIERESSWLPRTDAKAADTVHMV
jgi:hypothetical protein